uniref:BACK domain-containing protein n=1 Tax=Strongyloides stercoralis TaxID=6248 RepID=A0A0K0ER01_STRER
MVFKRFVSGPLTDHTSDYENEKTKIDMRSHLSTIIEDDKINVSYDEKTKYYEVNFEKQKELAKDIDDYTKSANCPSFVSIQLKNSENVKIPSLLFSYASCFIERIISQKKSYVYFVKAKEFDERQIKMILNFVMTGKLKFKLEDITGLFSIAHSFEMFSICTILETSMITFLKSNKSLLPILLNFSSDYKNIVTTKTKIHLLEMVNYYFNNFVTRQKFLKLTPQALIMVMSSDILKIKTEMDIFRIVVIYMCNKEMYGFADPMFNCIRFDFCSNETIKKMKKELNKMNKKYLSYVFECYYREFNEKFKECNSQFNNSSFKKNLNSINRNIDTSDTLKVSKFLEETIQNMIMNLDIKKNTFKPLNLDKYGIKRDDTKINSPKKFNVFPREPEFVKKIKVNKKKKQNNITKMDFDDLTSINPYKNIPKFNGRLFSSDSVFEINKFKNCFDENDQSFDTVDIDNFVNNNNVMKDKIEPNPYYHSYKDRENRQYRVDSIYDINQLESFYDNSQKSNSVKRQKYKIRNQQKSTINDFKEYLKTLHAQKENTSIKEKH